MARLDFHEASPEYSLISGGCYPLSDSRDGIDVHVIGKLPRITISSGTSEVVRVLGWCQPYEWKGRKWLKVIKTDSTSSSVPSWSSCCCCSSSWAVATRPQMVQPRIRQQCPHRLTPRHLQKILRWMHLQTMQRLSKELSRLRSSKSDCGVEYAAYSQRNSQDGAFPNGRDPAPYTRSGGNLPPGLFSSVHHAPETCSSHSHRAGQRPTAARRALHALDSGRGALCRRMPMSIHTYPRSAAC